MLWCIKSFIIAYVKTQKIRYIIVRFWKKFTFNSAQDVIRKPLVYSAHRSACWSQGSHSNFAREILRAIFSRVGWGGISYWLYVTLSCRNWKRNDFRYSSV